MLIPTDVHRCGAVDHFPPKRYCRPISPHTPNGDGSNRCLPPASLLPREEAGIAHPSPHLGGWKMSACPFSVVRFHLYAEHPLVPSNRSAEQRFALKAPVQAEPLS